MSEKPPIFAPGFFASAVRRCLLLLAFSLLAACQTGPPVQEMSDARMAIAVAKEAGAEQFAADQMQAAEEYLDRAEKRLIEKAYSQARRDAQNAKKSAMDALLLAEESRSSETD